MLDEISPEIGIIPYPTSFFLVPPPPRPPPFPSLFSLLLNSGLIKDQKNKKIIKKTKEKLKQQKVKEFLERIAKRRRSRRNTVREKRLDSNV